MKKKVVIANWKMNPESLVEAKKLFGGVKRGLSRMRKTKVVICPPALYLDTLTSSYRGTSLRFGSQDVSGKDKGSHTGEVSATMLRRSGADYCIVGHSERRALGETNEQVAEKIKSATSAGLIAILCVGERERDSHGEYLSFIEGQIRGSLEGVPRTKLSKLMIAYEPIWAIGKTARDAMRPDDVHQMHIFIRKTLSKIYGRKAALSVPILYGGSVEPTNTREFIEDADASGFLVGHASLIAKDFVEIVKTVDSI